MSHTGTDGSDLGDRLDRAGYRVLGVGARTSPPATATPAA